MTIAEKINAPDGFRYLDDEEMIDYLFHGFDQPLTIQERLDLIQDHGSPRRAPKDSTYERGDIMVDLENDVGRVEIQVIRKEQPQDQDHKQPHIS